MDVEDLAVYKLALALIRPVARLAALVEIHDRQQATDLRKTSRQIAPSISEGYAKRRFRKELLRFLGISMGTSDEMITHLRQVAILKYPNVNPATCVALIGRYKLLSKQLNVFMSRVRAQSDDPTSDI